MPHTSGPQLNIKIPENNFDRWTNLRLKEKVGEKKNPKPASAPITQSRSVARS